ncbi:MAG: ethanolamine ammonia-lyase reactivating factor EutA [Oscillospiraceae bacterium]
MDETILSAGIDVGTSTTQVIFSRMTVKNTGGFGSVPKIEIVGKEVVYESGVHFTPLLSENEIDGVSVRNIIEKEYEKSGFRPEDITTGAVIITGETSRKKNAGSVAEALSEIAGSFVVAAAGPDLESVLAGKGSGAAKLSAETGKVVANFDIGGGTTNICVFKNGEVTDTACLDIGGRLIKVGADRRITYAAKKLTELMRRKGVDISVGTVLMEELGAAVCREMVEVIEQAAGLREKDGRLELMITNHGLKDSEPPDIITFSGGVADCIASHGGDMLRYGDIGVYFGKALADSVLLMGKTAEGAEETIRATVIGAGNFSMEVSGSTIEYTGCELPMKSIPAAAVRLEYGEDIPLLSGRIKDGLGRFESRLTALAMKGLPCPSFDEIEAIAEAVCEGAAESIAAGEPLIIVLESDIGKALGQALKRRIKGKCGFICIDGISCGDGDFIDIGEPLAHGKVLPVIVKTLIFS